MDYQSYLAVRDQIAAIGQPLLYFTLALSVVSVVFTIHPALRKYSRHLLIATLISLIGGFLLIVWFHNRIWNYLPIVDLWSNKVAGRYLIPPWIENEKLYFWTLLTGIWVVVVRKRTFAFQLCMSIVMLVFVALTIFTSNPFVEPLGSFNEQIYGYLQAMNSQDTNAMAQGYYQTIGMLQGFYNSEYMWIHPPLLFFAYSTFVISFFGSVFMLIKKDVEYERFAYNWAKAGYIILTVGMLLGYPWTLSAWKGQPWWYSPKVNVAIMMWVIYSAYLHARLYLHRKGMWTTTAALGILGFISVVATYLATYVLPGIHSYKG